MQPRSKPFCLIIFALSLAILGGADAPCAKERIAERQMVAVADPRAAQAGLDMLHAGGSAVDAATAAQMVLGLVEPQSSGIGGGAFLLHYDAAAEQVQAYDGRETAPAAATPSLFLGPDGKPLDFFAAVVGGRSVGVPGLLRMLELAHRKHGRLPWATLFEPAIALAERGFAVSPRLHRLLAREEHLGQIPAARAYFYDAEGNAWPAGHILVNPAYAQTLRAVARGGADAFYEGEIASAIVEAVASHEPNPGLLSLADLSGYQAKERPSLCRPYRAWRVCGMPPPTSGGVTLLQILGILEHFDLASLSPGSAEAVHLISEASRLAYADRDQYLADPDFVPAPVEGLLDRGYLADRARLIDRERALGKARAGDPASRRGEMHAPGRSPELPSTSHLSIVDAEGNAVGMTTSIENAFGSRLLVRGFLLNNQLTDFSFRPEADGRPVANRVEPGKRPRSSMAPIIVLDNDGELRLAIGSPGGSRIIAYVAQAVIAVLDWGFGVDAAVALPHHVNRNGPTELEAATPIVALEPALEAMGHEVVIRALNSGLHGIQVTPAGYLGGADPRREGVAIGD